MPRRALRHRRLSQGAMVVDQFARDHPGLSVSSGGPVSGIILWADPEFNGNDSLSKGADPGASGFISTSGWLGAIGWYYTMLGGQRFTFPSAWSGRLHSYCTSDDGVCDWNPVNAPKIPTRHGDENSTPAITNDSVNAIQAQGSGWAPNVWDLGGSNDFYPKWQSLGGASGPLLPAPPGRRQDPGGSHAVRAPPPCRRRLAAARRRRGGKACRLGFCVTEETPGCLCVRCRCVAGRCRLRRGRG